MSKVVEEMRAILEGDENTLMHYGIARRSGRYPWGSGDDPYQHSMDLLGRYQTLKRNGMKESEIAKEMGYFDEYGKPSSSKLRSAMSNAKNERDIYRIETAKALKKDGLGPTEIGKKMGVPESTVRGWFDAEFERRAREARNTAEFIKKQIDTKGMIDVGAGVDKELGISNEKLKQALVMLEEEGYVIHKGRFEQVTNPGQWTTQKVICPPGTEAKEIYNLDKVHPLNEDGYVSHDGGETFDKFVYPKSMDSKRMMVRYADDVGADGIKGVEKDGIVEIRRGVDDLSLGDSHYAQVRILVDNDRYIKGMAVYSDNMPDGVDVVFNTNKTSDVAKADVLKKIKSDPDNPFGALIKANGQSYYEDADGNRQLSLINKTREEGDWTEWKDALPSQFLAKQSLTMVKKQLNLAKADKLDEFNKICELENPTVKKMLLEKFADECDSAAVHLQAAALPRQKYHVIIPINTLKDNEVYAPQYEPGTKLALIRYPHGGTFEIPILTVNNKNTLGKDIIGAQSIDAVGINKKIADQLSGADFDGDTVMVIPTHDKAGKVKISSKPPLKDLEGFDPKTEYGCDQKPIVDSDGTKHYYRNGREFKTMKNTGTQMGIISNLITDMTLAGATDAELARAVKHSMVVIDAEKHHLDYKASEIANNISALKKKYQTTVDADGKVHVGGAATILSRAKGETQVLKRQGTPKINIKGTDDYDPTRPEGALIYKVADDAEYTVTKTNKKTGATTTTTRYRHQRSTRMEETDDAYTLVSDARGDKELAYADYANSMKSLANKARVEMVTSGKIKYSSTANTTYKNEVNSLERKLNDALKNAPRERAAQRQARHTVTTKEQSDSTLKKKDLKKVGQQALTKARSSIGAVARKSRNIDITDREWEAIQAGAISESKLVKILNNTDIDKVRQRATPKSSTNNLSTASVNRIKSLAASNYTLSEIAKKLGVSTATVSKYLKEKE